MKFFWLKKLLNEDSIYLKNPKQRKVVIKSFRCTVSLYVCFSMCIFKQWKCQKNRATVLD